MFPSTTLRLFDRGFNNPVKYLKKKYDLSLIPFPL